MNGISAQRGNLDAALTVTFSPVILGFLVGALPVLVPLLICKGIARILNRPPRCES